MKYHHLTAELIDRQCRAVERLDFELDKEKAEKLVLLTYDLFKLKRPKKIIWLKDIFEKEFARSARSAWSAWSAWSAGSARSARSAWSLEWTALDWDFNWYVFEFEYCLNPDKDKLPNENDRLYLEYSELLMQAKEAGLGYWAEWKNVLYLVPDRICRLNALNQYHSVREASIYWKGGAEFYYLNGVNFPKDLWEKVVSSKMPFEEILAIEDIDQRTQAMRFGDVDKFIEHTKAELLDEYKKYTPELKEVNYKLYKISQGEIFKEDAYYMIYDDPSTFKKYMSGVPSCKTVAEAMSWKGDISPSEWLGLKPLISES